MKMYLILFILSFYNLMIGQTKSPSEQFMDNLKNHCGKTYQGKIISAPPNDDFTGKELIMHVRLCDKNMIKIPFHVGENRSRTWIFTLENDRITLKHDHRHEDGSDDKVTMYGGTNSNMGSENSQMFPADPFTCNLIPHACQNVWWVTVQNNKFTYNLRRVGTDRLFSIEFDLNNAVDTALPPWGWKD